MIGLEHGHLAGLFRQVLTRQDVEIAGIAEPDREMATRYARQYHLDAKLFYTSVEEMLDRVKPEAAVLRTPRLGCELLGKIIMRSRVAEWSFPRRAAALFMLLGRFCSHS